MLMHKYRRFETQYANYNTQSPMWSDYEILFIAIILTVCYNDSRWDKKECALAHSGVSRGRLRQPTSLSQQSGKKSNNIFYCK